MNFRYAVADGNESKNRGFVYGDYSRDLTTRSMILDTVERLDLGNIFFVQRGFLEKMSAEWRTD